MVRFAQEYNLPWQGEEELVERKEFVVLAVDDEPDLLQMVEDILGGVEGIKLIKASNGFSAGAKLVEERPDLLLLDFLMPELDGFEFARFVRQDARFKDIPIVAVTALKAEADRERVKEAGITEMIHKPFSVTEMTQMVARYRRLKEEKKAFKAA